MSGQLRVRAARFPQADSFDAFDFNAEPSLATALILELARDAWIAKRQNCIALGTSGTGNTYISLALGLVALDLNSLLGCARNGRT